jgi:putative nucleotidyltransferase with HDIG domain
MLELGKKILEILEKERPSEILWVMFNDKSLHDILPELTDLYVEQKGHKNNFVHTLMVLDNACEVSTDVWFRLAAVLHDIGKAKTRNFIDGEWTFRLHEEVGARMLPAIWDRFQFPQEKFALVEAITRYHGLAKEITKEDVSDSAVRRFFKETSEFFNEIILFCKCDITTRYQDKKIRLQQDLENLRIRAREIEKIDIEKAYRIPVDGVWLMEQTGLKPGKWIKEIKDEIESAIKSGKIEDEEDAAKDLAIEIMRKRNIFKF